MDLSSNGSTNPGLGWRRHRCEVTRVELQRDPLLARSTAVETLTLKPGTSLSGKLFKGVRLDLEMTGNARRVLKFSGGATGTTPDQYILQTGTSIDAAQRAEGRRRRPCRPTS